MKTLVKFQNQFGETEDQELLDEDLLASMTIKVGHPLSMTAPWNREPDDFTVAAIERGAVYSEAGKVNILYLRPPLETPPSTVH